MRRRTNFFPLIVLLLLFSSCAGKFPQGKVEVSPNALSDAVKTHMSFISLQSLARVVVESPEGKVVFDQVTLVKRPDVFEIAVFAPYGEMLLNVSSNGESVRMKTAREELVFENSEHFNLSFLYPGLSPHIGVKNIVDFLLAGAPFPFSQDTYTVVEPAKDGIAVFQSAGPWPSLIEFDLKQNSISAIHGLFMEGEEATVRFSRYKKVAPRTYFPTKLVFKTEGYSLSVTYGDDLRVTSDMVSSLSRSVEGK